MTRRYAEYLTFGRGVKYRVLILVLLVATTVLVVWAVIVPSIPDPVYGGKKLSFWIQEAATNRAAGSALCGLIDGDTNAAPRLIKALILREPPLWDRIRSELPKEVRRLLPGSSYSFLRRFNQGGMDFCIFNEHAEIFRNSLPELYHLTFHKTAPVRARAAMLLGKLYTNAPNGLSLVESTLKHTDEVVRISCLSTLRPVPTNQTVLEYIRKGLQDTNQAYQMKVKAALVRLSNELISTDRYLIQDSSQISEPPVNDKSTSVDAVRNIRCSVDVITNGPAKCGTAVAFTMSNLSKDKPFSVEGRWFEPEIFRISMYRPLTQIEKTNQISGGFTAMMERTRLHKPRPIQRHGDETFFWDLRFTIPPRASRTWVVPFADILDPDLGRHGEWLTNCSVFATYVIPIPVGSTAPDTLLKTNVCVVLP